ncbi:MAG TPA: site-2 protease family protein [Nocardioidaceae bacterium]|jgi:membrane-associated protease RseP (regulator of RpoE activity)|nr:site-2 protease family protein [Nocardioidaceae bacterium]
MTPLVYALGVVLFALGVLASIALHELGHLLPAKKFNVKVSQYFVGFGKTLWSTKRGETEYGIKMIPLGGYVRLVGMLPPGKDQEPGTVRPSTTGMFRALVDNARAAEYQHIQPEDEPRLFYRKKWWQKLIIMSGGPLVNVALAVLILGGVFMGIGVNTPKLVVAGVSDCVIPASRAAAVCKPGDPEAPAKAAGLRDGDRLVSFNGVRLDSWDQLTGLIRDNAGGRAVIRYERDGAVTTTTTNTAVSQRMSLDDPRDFVEAGFLGVSPVQVLERQGPGYVAATMWDYTVRTGESLLHLPEKMVGVFQAAFGGEERDQLGPVSVVGASRIAGELAATQEISVTERAATILGLLGVVNLFVALFNFIPLLPLDGGHIAGALYEAVRRGFARLRGRPDPGYVDVAKLLPVAYVAAVVITAMGALLVYADIVNPVTLG